MKTNSIKGYLSSEQLDGLAEEIRKAEESTRGEIRLTVIRKRPWLQRKFTPEQIAWNEFRRLQMDKTKERTGILLMVLLKERVFHILADEGIHSLVSGDPWGDIAGNLAKRFREGEYAGGLTEAIREMGRILRTHVPQKPGDTNELPNTVEVR